MKASHISRSRRAATTIIGMATAATLALTGCTSQELEQATGSGAENTIDKTLAGQVDEAVKAGMQAAGATQALVGVWQGDKAYLRGYGKGSENFGGNTPFYTAQVGGIMTCALTLQLAANGTITLDRELTKDLRRQNGIDGITYQQLCNNTSALPDYAPYLAEEMNLNPSRYYTEQELISESLIQPEQKGRGSTVRLSNTNGVLLGRALHIKTGQELSELLLDHVFIPAEMANTVYPDPEAAKPISGGMKGLTYLRNADGPVCDGGAKETAPVSSSMLAGAGGEISTPNDVKKFLTAYVAGKFGGELAKKALADAQGITTVSDGKDVKPVDGGPQWRFGIKQVGPLLGQSGSVTGTITAAYTDPASGFTVVLALNNSAAGAGLAETLALQLAALAKEAGNGPEVGWSSADEAALVAQQAVCQPAAQ